MSNDKIRILQVLGTLNAGGAESRMMDVYRNIDKSKVQFDFLIFDQGHQHYEDEVLALGGTIYKIDKPSIKNMHNHIRDIRRCISNGQYNVVHAHTLYHCGVVMYAAWRERVPIRISHARNSGTVRKKNKIAIAVGKFLIREFATHRLAVSTVAGDFLYGKDHFEVIPNAIDVNRYSDVSPNSIESLRNKYSILNNSVVIGHVGRFNQMKNHDFIVEWFSSYYKKHTNSFLFLIGDGPLKDEIQDKVRQIHLEDRIIFTGIVNNVNELMHLFSVFILPSFFEGLPGVVLEAQASGIPSVVSNYITDEVDMGLGLVFKCNLDIEKWAESVDKCLGIQHRTTEEIREAFYKKHFSLESEIDKLMKIYNGKE